jgi:hypothetical protein
LEQNLEILIASEYINELKIYGRNQTTKEIFIKTAQSFDTEIL